MIEINVGILYNNKKMRGNNMKKENGITIIALIISIICSILLCTMVMYIISTAIILIVGG